MMKKIRRGNDILITWTIKRGEEAEVFPENTSVFLHASDGSCVDIEVGFIGNVVTVNYRGRNQARLGEYRLLLVENNGGNDMVTLDHTPAFVLVDRSALAGGEDDTITTEVVELTDTLEVAQGGGGTTDYNDLANKPAINGVKLVGNKTSSDLSLLTEQQLEEGLATKQDTIEDLDDIREGSDYGHTSVQPEDLAPYRTASAQDIIDADKQPTISDLNAIRNGAAAGATAVQPSTLNNYATKTELQTVEGEIPSVTDNVTSTSAEDALSAKQGKLLNDRINNLATRGRFLSLWNCVTGLPLTNPSGTPYTYQTGDFFIVSAVGATNYVPNGSSYTGQPSTTVYSGAIKVNDTIFYDGTSWMVLDTPAGASDIQDVYQNGSSVVSGGIAYVVVPTKTSDLTNDSGYQNATQVQQTVEAHHDDTKVDKVTGKQLSTEDYTTTEKNKLAGIAAGAEVNVQANWNQTNTTADDYIKNKPTIPTQLSQLSDDTTHRTVTDTEKSTWNDKLSDAPSDGEQYARKDGAWIKVSIGRIILG